MKYYPINLNIKNKNCLVVGGGSVGARKASLLVKCGAVTTVISPEFSSAFEGLDSQGVMFLKKEYKDNDLKNMFLVIGATNNSELNFKISMQAKKKGILCNIADLPEESDFILPSIVDRNDLLITISTSGKSPALAKKIKEDMEHEFGSEYADFLYIMGKIRKRLLSKSHAPDEHKIIFQKLINSELIDTIKDKDYAKTNDLLHKLLGKGYTYENLLSGDK
ncbi:MAG: bifunctional precorrin-2 dehydrogenase/sirohydrochlorin ferrochelatase [Desulfobacteraceae bacterium]|nr:bifunctional precorrin-2 dehydrogenase/sirohydrochlorin ferrochelatase [Desulfobacteraceae bacterium]